MWESLWARVRGEASKADSVVGVSYRPARPGEEVGEPFFEIFEEVSVSQMYDTAWKDSVAGHKQSSFLETIRGNFPIHVPDGPSRGDTQLDLCLTRMCWWARVISRSPSYSDHKIVVFKIPRGMRKKSSRAQILDFMRTDFGLFRNTKADYA